MTAKEAADLLDVIANRAQGLRQLGVLRVDLGVGIGFTLADPEIESGAAAGAKPDDETPRDALEDPETFGIRGPEVSQRLPRRRRDRLVEPES